jgi:hypothetical protein
VTTVHLYDLANARAILDEFLAETEGEVTPALEELIEQLDGDVTDKVERVALYIREQLATAAAVKEEEARLAARRKSHERAAEGLKNYLQRQLERLGKTKVDGVLCTVALQPSPPSVKSTLTQQQLQDLWDTHEGDVIGVWRPLLVEIPEQYALDKRRVLDAYKAGQRLPDGVSIEQSAHLRIR